MSARSVALAAWGIGFDHQNVGTFFRSVAHVGLPADKVMNRLRLNWRQGEWLELSIADPRIAKHSAYAFASQGDKSRLVCISSNKIEAVPTTCSSNISTQLKGTVPSFNVAAKSLAKSASLFCGNNAPHSR